MPDKVNQLGEDWLTALARLEQAAVKYQVAFLAAIQHGKVDLQGRGLDDERWEALRELAAAAVLMPLEEQEEASQHA